MRSKRRPVRRAILCGYYGQGNGGDEALLATLLQLLPPGVEPLVLSGNPAETRDRYGVTAIPRKSGRALWAALRSSDALIWGGGSLMQDATSWASPLYYAGLMIAAQALGLRRVAWAQGVGPLKRGWILALTRSIFQRCDGVTVRDRASASLLKTWQVKGVEMAPDPVWVLASPPVAELAPGPKVAVALRSHRTLTLDRLARLAEALDRFQTQTGALIVLIPFQPIADGEVAEYLADRLGSGRSRIVSETDPARLKGLFRQMDLTIGMRLHALIMAAAEGSRCWGLSYDPKVRVLLEAIGAPGWDLETTAGDRALPTTAEAIAAAWLAAWQQPNPIAPEQVQQLRDRAQVHRLMLARSLA
ncbi:MAG: polysaccharide pyruvyl transferase CsaB [Oscillatoriales cyanobacterium]|nr:MAG: polysaccharide pyruvyl transferase CsaB [Oscillatoriales cyanobacterium]